MASRLVRDDALGLAGDGDMLGGKDFADAHGAVVPGIRGQGPPPARRGARRFGGRRGPYEGLSSLRL